MWKIIWKHSMSVLCHLLITVYWKHSKWHMFTFFQRLFLCKQRYASDEQFLPAFSYNTSSCNDLSFCVYMCLSVSLYVISEKYFWAHWLIWITKEKNTQTLSSVVKISSGVKKESSWVLQLSIKPERAFIYKCLSH